MYSIVHIIYGVPITHKIANTCEDPDELKEYGFHTFYSGSADSVPGYCGVKLGGFDECQSALPVSQLTLTPTPEQMAEAKKACEALPPAIRELCEPLGVYFIFTTS